MLSEGGIDFVIGSVNSNEVAACEECDQEDTDFAGQITSIVAKDPDIVVMCLQGNTFGPFLKQLRNMGYTGMVCAISRTLLIS